MGDVGLRRRGPGSVRAGDLRLGDGSHQGRPPPTSLAGSFTLAPESVTSLVEMAAAGASAGASALSEEMHGVDAVTRFFAGGAKAARLTLVDGLAGAVVSSPPHSAR